MKARIGQIYHELKDSSIDIVKYIFLIVITVLSASAVGIVSYFL